ncbi:Rho GTPase-activating protein [Trachipleistophora hominis]|uniref:Rho GTPase-activating protein n=1 Tax=Trachipleistophora hominis TaxID=72359 RepID=L7JSS2_TRAHO|nr:Rho GTPase-activating protein [Trachipleistophora hominis]
MNESYINQRLTEKQLTVNDIDDEDVRAYLENFVEENLNVLRSVFSVIELRTIPGANYIPNVYKFKEFSRENGELQPTRLKYSYSELYIPSELNEIMEFFLTLDLTQRGIFKRSPSIVIVEAAIKDFEECMRTRSSIHEKLARYDAITIPSVFKNVFNYYEMPLFPKEFVDYFCRIKRLPRIDDQHTALKFLLLCMPRTNRSTLEAVIRFIEIVHELASQKDEEHQEHMDFSGFVSVMMPKLMLKSNIRVRLENLKDLIDMLLIVFRKYSCFVGVVD